MPVAEMYRASLDIFIGVASAEGRKMTAREFMNDILIRAGNIWREHLQESAIRLYTQLSEASLEDLRAMSDRLKKRREILRASLSPDLSFFFSKKAVMSRKSDLILQYLIGEIGRRISLNLTLTSSLERYFKTALDLGETSMNFLRRLVLEILDLLKELQSMLSQWTGVGQVNSGHEHLQTVLALVQNVYERLVSFPLKFASTLNEAWMDAAEFAVGELIHIIANIAQCAHTYSRLSRSHWPKQIAQDVNQLIFFAPAYVASAVAGTMTRAASPFVSATQSALSYIVSPFTNALGSSYCSVTQNQEGVYETRLSLSMFN